MSMLTPAGEGAQRRSGGRRTAITLVLAVLLLAGAGYGAWNGLMGAGRAGTTPAAQDPSACATEGAAGGKQARRTKPSRARDVKVNVYNATRRAGLAGAVSDQLEDRGFRLRNVANDPTDRDVKGVAEVRHGTKGRAAALTLRAHVPGAVLVKDRRKTAVVDLALGSRLRRLATTREAAVALRRQAGTGARC